MLTASEAVAINPSRLGEKEPQVIIDGLVHFYKDKAPYVSSGYSLMGALEYDVEEDKIKCHECGRWLKSISAHIGHCKKAKGKTVAEYKLRHGFKRTASLVTESTRKKQIECGRIQFKRLKEYIRSHRRVGHNNKGLRIRTTETENLRNACRPQILKRLKDLAAQVGHTPSHFEMKSVGIQYKDLRWHFGSAKNAMRIAELVPRSPATGRVRFHTKESLLALIKNFYQQHGRRPSYSDMRRGILPTGKVFRRVFQKTFSEVLLLAHLPVDRQVACRMISDQELLSRLRRAARFLGRPPRLFADKVLLTRKFDLPVYSVLTRFGSWTEALKKIGQK